MIRSSVVLLELGCVFVMTFIYMYGFKSYVSNETSNLQAQNSGKYNLNYEAKVHLC